MLCGIMPSVTIPSVIMPNVFIQNTIMQSVARNAECLLLKSFIQCHYATSHNAECFITLNVFLSV